MKLPGASPFWRDTERVSSDWGTSVGLSTAGLFIRAKTAPRVTITAVSGSGQLWDHVTHAGLDSEPMGVEQSTESGPAVEKLGASAA